MTKQDWKLERENPMQLFLLKIEFNRQKYVGTKIGRRTGAMTYNHFQQTLTTNSNIINSVWKISTQAYKGAGLKQFEIVVREIYIYKDEALHKKMKWNNIERHVLGNPNNTNVL